LEIWGPQGTQQMVNGMRMMYGHDVEHRANPTFKREYLDITVHEISEGVVYNDGGVKVTAFPVEHDDGNPAFGYRIDAVGRSILLSGDTTYSENVVKYGMNDDLIVSNVVAFSDAMTKAGVLKPVLNKLTTPEQAAANPLHLGDVSYPQASKSWVLQSAALRSGFRPVTHPAPAPPAHLRPAS
jgi:ribonuclease Z